MTLQNFEKCFLAELGPTQLEQADEYLQSLVRDISDDSCLESFEDELKWSLHCFLSTYSSMLTQLLQNLQQIEDEQIKLANQLTGEIDLLKGKYRHTLCSQPVKGLIQEALKEEQAKDKPAERAVRRIAHTIFSVEKNQIDPEKFSNFRRVLKPIYLAFS